MTRDTRDTRAEFADWCTANGLYANDAKFAVWQAVLAAAPAWHPAPTVPGLWLCSDGRAFVFSDHVGETFGSVRWYGPIPQEPAL